MQNKIKSLTNIIQQLINEITHLRELGVGTLETLKLMPGYEDAIEALKKQMIEKNKELKKAEQNGTIEQDIK
tara:strand:- start:401 stop:616 length:216 start_codon:yes stop_codon:yes gene_type:complete